MERTFLPPASDPFALERLACARLAGMVQGVLTVGVPLLVYGEIDPREFFDGRFCQLQAFATVLGCASGGPEVSERVSRLRVASRDIGASLCRVEKDVFAAIERPPGPTRIGDALQPAVDELFDALAAYANALGADAGVTAMRDIVSRFLAALQTELQTSEPVLHSPPAA